MNSTPYAKTILCYGDSNTWGQTPDKTGKRYPVDVRWTGLLQTSLGDEYNVIEEGLSSRTTDIDYVKKPGRNGRTYLEPCLDSHAPIDTVILMLGTNDFKLEFNRSVEEISEAIQGLIELIQAKTARYSGNAAKVILVSPILIDDQAAMHKEWYSAYYNEASVEKSKALAGRLEMLALAMSCSFVDAAQVAKAGRDGLHLDKASHRALSDVLLRQWR